MRSPLVACLATVVVVLVLALVSLVNVEVSPERQQVFTRNVHEDRSVTEVLSLFLNTKHVNSSALLSALAGKDSSVAEFTADLVREAAAIVQRGSILLSKNETEQLVRSIKLAQSPPNKDANGKLREEEVELVRKVPLYVITPTYPRMTQMAEMTRLGQTLKWVENMIWLVAEDTKKENKPLVALLDDLGVSYEYFRAPMPDEYRKKNGSKPRGVSNRNRALEWILANASDDGVFYFADDDNSYDLKLFTEIRRTKTVSVFPVGIIGKYELSTPIVAKGKVTGFYDSYISDRKFILDMAGFAVNSGYYKKMSQIAPVKMPFKAGKEEDGFLRLLGVEPADLEPLADNASQVLVWHTQTKGRNKPEKEIDAKKHAGTNLVQLKRYYDSLTSTF